MTRWPAKTDFLDRHAGKIAGVPLYLDRAVITAILPDMSHTEAATRFLFNANLRIFNRHPPGQAGRTAAVEGRLDVDGDPGGVAGEIVDRPDSLLTGSSTRSGTLGPEVAGLEAGYPIRSKPARRRAFAFAVIGTPDVLSP